MHQLTIDHDSQSVAISGHPSFNEAHRALLQYVVKADYYLRAVHTSPERASFELLCLADPDDPAPSRRPHVTGMAVIEELANTGLPAPSPYFAACDAQRWLADHACKWVHGSTSDPGDRHPMSVLTLAHGEASGLLPTGTLLPEAAHLAGAPDAAPADPQTLEALRHNAISGCARTDTPAAVAAAAQQSLPAGVGADQIAVLVWYYTLIAWGASGP